MLKRRRGALVHAFESIAGYNKLFKLSVRSLLQLERS